jgi:hypothetical protein
MVVGCWVGYEVVFETRSKCASVFAVPVNVLVEIVEERTFVDFFNEF